MNELEIGIAVAFAAGVLSFLSPCVLPLVPSYLSFVSGVGLEELEHGGGDVRRTAFIHSLFFVLGFSLVFLALGASATLVGRLLREYQVWIARIGGAVIVLFGLYLLGLRPGMFLQRERRVHLRDKPLGYLGSTLVGITFGAGWSPCIGPILGGILTFAATRQTMTEGLVLLGFYSAGLAVPDHVRPLQTVDSVGRADQRTAVDRGRSAADERSIHGARRMDDPFHPELHPRTDLRRIPVSRPRSLPPAAGVRAAERRFRPG